MHRFDARLLLGVVVLGRAGCIGRVGGLQATLLLHVTERPGKVLVSRLFFSRVSMPAAAVQSNEQTNLHC